MKNKLNNIELRGLKLGMSLDDLQARYPSNTVVYHPELNGHTFNVTEYPDPGIIDIEAWLVNKRVYEISIMYLDIHNQWNEGLDRFVHQFSGRFGLTDLWEYGMKDTHHWAFYYEGTLHVMVSYFPNAEAGKVWSVTLSDDNALKVHLSESNSGQQFDF